jgi:hypothetical protein
VAETAYPIDKPPVTLKGLYPIARGNHPSHAHAYAVGAICTIAPTPNSLPQVLVAPKRANME